MAVIEFPGGVKVTTFAHPPKGFNPLKADQHTLIRHGFPRRPEHDETLLRRWEKMMGRRMHFVEPTFRLNEHKRHGPRRRSEVAGTETSTNWSGVVVYAQGGSTFTWVEGQWTVPNVVAPAADGTWYYCSSWVGIDGDGSSDVFQAGVETEVLSILWITERRSYAWWEWFPAGEVAITNIPVAPGDALSVLLCVDSSTTGTIFFSNTTSGLSTSFQVTAPSGTQLSGNCAEWIVERPGVDGATSNLANYGVLYFNNANAGTANSQTIQAGSGDDINMDDNNNNVISEGFTLSATEVECLYV